jgi:alpha-L-fucosidase
MLARLVCFLLFTTFAFAQATAVRKTAAAAAPGSEDRTAWWRDAKFGMFIHWGPYAVIGRHEWARHRYEIPQAEYDKYARAFNPVKFNADAWVDLAKNAGAKYIVITSKHHDGFSIYRSKVSDYDMEITPYKGDPLRMLADSAKRKGMRLGFYHSIMDWHHPDYVPKRAWEVPGQPSRKSNDDPGGNIDKYIEFMKAQIRELLTEYGPVATMWFDGEWEHTLAEMHSDEVFDMIRQVSPSTLINDRIYKRQPGNRADHGTPEQFVPATGEKGPDGKPILWESCVTINTDSWGYNKYETEFKTPRDLIRMLVEVVSKGGNLLLNVGPKPDGTIQQEFVTRLNAMGDWIKVNSESIYGTTASPFTRLPFFGRATTKGNTIYLHVFQWPKDGVLRMPGVKNNVLSASLLASPGSKLSTRRDGDDVLITLPATAPDEISSTVRVVLEGAPNIVASPTRPDASGVFDLGVASAEIETRFEQRAKKENLLGHVYLTHWSRPDDVPVWQIQVPQAGRYKVEIMYAAGGIENKTFEISAGNSKITTAAKRGPNDLVFRTYPAGEIDLSAGEQDVRVKPANGNLSGVSLEGVRFTPLR